MKILNQAQAEAVYSAMCALNNVGGKLKAVFGDASGKQGVTVFENALGIVRVIEIDHYKIRRDEDYAAQAAFAAAYNLQ